MPEWLTWQAVRALATCEALVPRSGAVLLARPDPRRPVIKWTCEAHWLTSAVPMTPQPGEIIYTRTAWRAPCRAALRQAVTVPSVLVTAFCDHMVRAAAVDELCASGSPIRSWFGVQTMARHPALIPMPVGVEAENIPLFAQTARAATRDILLYVNFTRERLFLERPIRHWVWAHFASLPWVTAEPIGDPRHYVQQLGRAKFVLSPPGYGWDCYRTYEALVMGAIPVVRRHDPCSAVVQGLPVLVVDRWADITPERLQREWDRGLACDLTRLTWPYWRDRIRAAARAAC